MVAEITDLAFHKCIAYISTGIGLLGHWVTPTDPVCDLVSKNTQQITQRKKQLNENLQSVHNNNGHDYTTNKYADLLGLHDH